MKNRIEPNIIKFAAGDFRVEIVKAGEKIRRRCRTLKEARKFKAFVKKNDCIDYNSEFDLADVQKSSASVSAVSNTKTDYKYPKRDNDLAFKIVLSTLGVGLIVLIYLIMSLVKDSSPSDVKQTPSAEYSQQSQDTSGNSHDNTEEGAPNQDDEPEKKTSLKEMFPNDMVISMGADHDKVDAAHRLYVFEDPSCGACKLLNPALEKLNDISVTIIPTAILETSDKFMGGIACASNKLEAWKRAIYDGIAMDNSCPGGKDAHIRAYNFFRASGFKSTPTLISGDGRIHAGAMDGNPTKIRAWLAGK